jgi:hypothetical protein
MQGACGPRPQAPSGGQQAGDRVTRGRAFTAPQKAAGPPAHRPCWISTMTLPYSHLPSACRLPHPVGCALDLRGKPGRLKTGRPRGGSARYRSPRCPSRRRRPPTPSYMRIQPGACAWPQPRHGGRWSRASLPAAAVGAEGWRSLHLAVAVRSVSEVPLGRGEAAVPPAPLLDRSSRPSAGKACWIGGGA